MKKIAVYTAFIALLITAIFFPLSQVKAQQPTQSTNTSASETDPLGYRNIIQGLLRLLSGGIGSSTEQSTQPTSTPSGSSAQPSTQPSVSSSQPASDNQIVGWARQINAALERGTWDYFNRQLATISNGHYSAQKRTGDSIYNLYWCTNIIIDAYTLSGYGGLNVSHQAVLTMRRFFASSPNYTYLDFRPQDTHIRSSLLAKVKPGYVIIMQSVFDQFAHSHVAIVGTINLDSHCNGYIDTIEANSSRKTHRYVIDNCNIIYSAFPVVAFAGK